MRYGIVIRQAGEGCDYTIGCGMRFYALTANNRNAAIEEAKEYLHGTEIDEYCDQLLVDERGRPNLDHVTLVRIETDLPIDEWYKELVAAENARKKAAEEAKEKFEFERLKGKYG